MSDTPDDPRRRAEEARRSMAPNATTDTPDPDPDLLRRMEEAMLNMPKLQREIFLAHRLDDMSYGEIAERTGLSVRQVERHMAKAIYKLVKQMDGEKLSCGSAGSERRGRRTRQHRFNLLGSIPMRTDLDHLPPAKQRELERVVQILFEEFEEKIALGTQDWKRKGHIQKIILYGSYARGNWVDEPHTAKGYQSDFDLLIIVNDKRLTDRVEYWANADDQLIRELSITKTLRTPVNFIVHTLQEVNDGLAHGRYFFIDVAKEGIALYQSDETDLPEPKPKTPEQALAMAKEYFEEWYPAGVRAHVNFHDDLKRGWNKDAAFMLHQATERLYHCILLVCTFYTPHVHNLAFLRTQAERIDRRLVHIWPQDSRRDRRLFEKLKAAYVKARYSRHYRISEDELTWLGERVEELGQVVQVVCSERIAMLEAQAKAA